MASTVAAETTGIQFNRNDHGLTDQNNNLWLYIHYLYNENLPLILCSKVFFNENNTIPCINHI